MRARISIAAVAALAALLTVAAGGAAGASKTVRLGDNFFQPQRVAVSKNTRVKFRWVNTRNPHNVTKVRGPGRGFASPTTSADGVNFRKRFRRPGVYRMICTVHPNQMRLRLKVRRRG